MYLHAKNYQHILSGLKVTLIADGQCDYKYSSKVLLSDDFPWGRAITRFTEVYPSRDPSEHIMLKQRRCTLIQRLDVKC